MRAVVVFQFISCSMAWAIFFLCPSSLRQMAEGKVMWGAIMWTPAIAAVLSRGIFLLPCRTPVWGTRKRISLAFYLVPFFILAVIAKLLDDEEILQSLGDGLFVSGFVMTLGEELGWRGFLTPHLAKRFLAPIAWIFTGCLWEIWHLPFRSLNEPFQVASRAGSTILLACVLGYMARRYNSLAVCVALHLWANLMIDFKTQSCYISLLLSLAFWLIMTIRHPAVQMRSARERWLRQSFAARCGACKWYGRGSGKPREGSPFWPSRKAPEQRSDGSFSSGPLD